MSDGHVPLEFAGADPHERNAVAMAGIHVRLDFENETGERRVSSRNLPVETRSCFGLGGMFEESIQQQLHSEIIARAAKKDGRSFSSENFALVKCRACQFEHLQFFGNFMESGVIE